MNSQVTEKQPEKAIAYNYMNLLDLYVVFGPKEIPILLARLKQYLLDGHKWYQKNVKNITLDDIEYELQDIEELHDVTEAMLIVSGNYMAFGSKDRDFEVNLVPFNKFLKRKPHNKRLDSIKFIQTKMRLFLNDTNITTYKECHEFLDAFHYALEDIEKKDAFEYL